MYRSCFSTSVVSDHNDRSGTAVSTRPSLRSSFWSPRASSIKSSSKIERQTALLSRVTFLRRSSTTRRLLSYQSYYFSTKWTCSSRKSGSPIFMNSFRSSPEIREIFPTSSSSSWVCSTRGGGTGHARFFTTLPRPSTRKTSSLCFSVFTTRSYTTISSLLCFSESASDRNASASFGFGCRAFKTETIAIGVSVVVKVVEKLDTGSKGF